MKKFLVLKPNQKWEVIEKDSLTLEEMERTVGGTLGCVSFIKPLAERNIDIWLNDEGKIIDLPMSLMLHGGFSDTLHGNLLFAKHDNEGNTLPLNDSDITFIKELIHKELSLVNMFTGEITHQLYELSL